MNNTNTAYAITKAIGYTENGGKPDVVNPSAGKTGETASIFQYEPSTWDSYSQQVAGKSIPLTPDNEVAVTQAKVQQWLNQGLTPQQIFSSWNAGTGEPNAYTGRFSNGQSSVGTNEKYGIKYNVPAYVDTAMSYFNKFSQASPSQTPTTTTPNPPTATLASQTMQNTPQSNQSSSGGLQGLIGSLLPPTS